MKQMGILFLHLGEFVFLALDDDSVERVWDNEAAAVADLAKEGWEITSAPSLIEQDIPENAARRIVGYRMERNIQ